MYKILKQITILEVDCKWNNENKNVIRYIINMNVLKKEKEDYKYEIGNTK